MFQEPVELGPPSGVKEQRLQALVGLLPRPLPGARYPANESDQPWADHPLGAQVIAGELDQKRRAVVLERPSQEEVVKGLELPNAGGLPAETSQHLPEVVPPGAVFPATAGDTGAMLDAELVGEPSHCRAWRGGQSRGRSPATAEDVDLDVVVATSSKPR